MQPQTMQRGCSASARHSRPLPDDRPQQRRRRRRSRQRPEMRRGEATPVRESHVVWRLQGATGSCREAGARRQCSSAAEREVEIDSDTSSATCATAGTAAAAEGATSRPSDSNTEHKKHAKSKTSADNSNRGQRNCHYVQTFCNFELRQTWRFSPLGSTDKGGLARHQGVSGITVSVCQRLLKGRRSVSAPDARAGGQNEPPSPWQRLPGSRGERSFSTGS